MTRKDPDRNKGDKEKRQLAALAPPPEMRTVLRALETRLTALEARPAG